MDIDMHRRLCYIASMKKILICLLCLFSLLPTADARIDANQLLGGLLQIISEPQQDSQPQKQDAPGFSEQMALMARAAAAPLLESFKEEGREYAKEVGDIITRRIKEDKKINQTLDSMRLFCWGVVIYLTIVTALVIYLLLRLHVLHSRLMQAISEVKEK